MSKNNPELCKLSEALFVKAAIDQEAIGGGSVRVYDNNDPAQAGGLGSPYPAVTDASDLEAKMYMVELANGRVMNAAIAYTVITSKIDIPGIWKQKLQATATEEAPKAPNT